MATEKEITRDYSVTSLVCKDYRRVKQEMCLKTGVSLPIHPFVEEAAKSFFPDEANHRLGLAFEKNIVLSFSWSLSYD